MRKKKIAVRLAHICGGSRHTSSCGGGSIATSKQEIHQRNKNADLSLRVGRSEVAVYESQLTPPNGIGAVGAYEYDLGN